MRKGFRQAIDSYSAFFENDHTTPTGLGGHLRERGFKRVFLCGIATDFCVRFSAEDAKALGFEAYRVPDLQIVSRRIGRLCNACHLKRIERFAALISINPAGKSPR